MRAIIMFICAALLAAAPALAHRVNVFAWTEDGKILVECSYSRSQKVNRGRIEVLDAASGSVLLSETTDEQGNCAIPIQESFRANGVVIRLKAGEGHQDDFALSVAELGGAPAPAPEAAPAQEQAAQPAAPESRISTAELDRVVSAALEKQLAPIRRALAEKETGPSLRDIVGGIGWIFGLVGVAAFFMGRNRRV